MSGSTGSISSSATGISFSGLASGVDTQSIIQKMIQFESRPISVLDSQILGVSQKQAAWTAISTAVSTFSSAAQALNDPATWAVVKSTSSDSSKITISSSTGAVAGQYVIKSNAPGGNPMALAEQDVSRDFSDHTTALGVSGTIYLGLGGAHATGSGSIDVTTTDTLDTLVTKINSANLGITASVVQTSSTTYKLELSGRNTGSANRIYYDDNGTGVLTAGAGLGLVTGTTNNENVVAGGLIQTAQDARFTVNGLAFTSSSNTISSAIPNTTINLVNLTDGDQVTITNSSDTAGIQNSVQNFVNAYNNLESTVGKYTAKGGVLQGNSSALSLMNMLSRDMTSVISGLPSTMNNLAQIGVEIKDDGTLSFDTGKFQSVLASDASDVQALFNKTSTGFSELINAQLTPYTETNGIFAELDQSFTDQIKSMNDRESAMKTRLQQRQDSLVQQFSAMEQTISRLKAQGDQIMQVLSSLQTSSSSSK